MQIITFSTTGTLDPVAFTTMGSRDYAHPTVDYDLTSEFEATEILEDPSFLAALDAGHITVKVDGGSTITTSGDLDTETAMPSPHALGGTEHTSATLAELNALVSDATLIDTTDSRLSDSRPPSGAAGGALGGTFPNPTVDGMTSGVLTDDTAHGTRGGGSLHAVAVGGVSAGFVSATDQSKLDNLSGTNTGDEVAASTTVQGVIELATQAEVDTGTDAVRAVTPATLAGTPSMGHGTGSVTQHSDVSSAGSGVIITVAERNELHTDHANRAALDNISGTNTGDEVQATTTVQGVIELATQAEVNAGADTDRAVTPATLAGKPGLGHGTGLVTQHSDVSSAGSGAIITTAERNELHTDHANRAALDNISGTNTGDEPDASTTVKGVIELATQAEVDTGADTTRAVTPATLAAKPGLGHGTGLVTQHSDVTSAGSGAIITVAERNELHTDHANRAALDLVSGTNTGDEPDASTTVKGIVELATDGEGTAGLAVQANDSRLSDSRPPSGTAGGGLSGTFPNPTVDGMTSGVLTDDTAHGNRGGGDLHADVVAGGADGFMKGSDKQILDNLAGNGMGDAWTSGLTITADTPSTNQTIDYASGTYLINGITKTIAVGGDYNLTNGYLGVNHFAALAASQRATAIICVDNDQVIKSTLGAVVPNTQTPPPPTAPADSVCLAYVNISKKSSGGPNKIENVDITDLRQATPVGSDEFVKVTGDDTTTSHLRNKLTDDGNVTFTIQNAGGNENLKADVADMVGDSGSGGTQGLVPAPAAGDAAAGKFLKADGLWTAPSGSGDVVGPGSAVADNVALFDGTTGKLIKDSGLALSGSNTGDEPDASTTVKGIVELATDGESAAGVVVQGNDSRLTNARTPTSHALGGAEHSTSTLAQLNAKVSDATLIDTTDARLSDARTPTAHNLGGAEHNADTLANLNSKVSDGTLVDVTAGVAASRPAAGTAGRFYFATDTKAWSRDNGSTWDDNSGTGGGSSLTVEDEGTPLTTNATKMNFAGAGVTVTEPVADEMLVTIPGGGGSSTLAAVQARRTTAYTLTTGWVDVTLDTTDEETDAAALNHDSVTNTARIEFLEAGTYLLSYSSVCDNNGTTGTTISTRLYKNGTTLVPGSQTDESIDQSSQGDVPASMSRAGIIFTAATDDYVTLQAKATVISDAPVLSAGLIVTAVKLDGVTGATGATGAAGADGDITWQNAWVTATAYTTNQAVSNGGSSYVCISNHTSSASDEPGVGGSWATYWEVLASKGDTGPPGTPSQVFTTQPHNALAKSVTTATYAPIVQYPFLGSTALGTPSAIKITGYVGAGTAGKARIYDLTNSLVICELTGISNTTASVLDLGTISNVPTGEAVWEVQLAGDDVNTMNCSGVAVEF